MKVLSFSLLILAMVVSLSSALPVDKERDGTSGLLEWKYSNGQEKSLQRKKPPAKIPGPKFNSDDEDSDGEDSKEKKGKKLISSENGQFYGFVSVGHGISGSRRNAYGHLVNDGRDNTNLTQESQAERNNHRRRQ